MEDRSQDGDHGRQITGGGSCKVRRWILEGEEMDLGR